MQASELMTRDVITVTPDTPVREVARTLLDHAVSAAPVVDPSGAPVGMISEGDLIGRSDSDRDGRRDWWLALLAEGNELNPEFLKSVTRATDTAGHLMAAPVVTVEETTDAREIARLLAQYRIKRVPVVRDGRVVGIVSRADLLRAVAEEPPEREVPKRNGGFLSDLVHGLDRAASDDAGHAGERPPPGETGAVPDASAFQSTTKEAKREETRRRTAERRAAEQRRHRWLQELIDTHVADRDWSDVLARAKQAAERGETEFELLRFPSDLCSDGGRAINVAELDWPATLRGEAAEMYLRWQHQLKPHGFHLSAQIIEFPGGKPGDVSLMLSWGG